MRQEGSLASNTVSVRMGRRRRVLVSLWIRWPIFASISRIGGLGEEREMGEETTWWKRKSAICRVSSS